MSLFRTRRFAVVGLALAVIVVVLVVFGSRLNGEEPASGSDGDERTGTATVERRDLVDRESVEGTYGYGNERSIVNQLGDGGGGGNGAPASDNSPASDDPGTYFASDEAPPVEENPEEDCDDDEAGDGEGDCDDDRNEDDRQPEDRGDEPPNENRQPQRQPQRGAGPAASSGSPQGKGTPSGGDGGTGGGGGDTNPEQLTLTSTARPGTTLRRGDTLYRVDDDPVVLMYGSTPAWRDMSPGISKGRDVAQLEQNLVALGHADFEPDGTYDANTTTAVRKWQRANGLPETGTVEHGRVVFMNGARRAGSRIADLGTTLNDGTEVMTTTSTTRLVKVDLPVGKQSLVKEGDAVTVTLPDGTDVEGRIRSLGRVAHAVDDNGDSQDPGGGGGGGGSTESVLDMTVALSDKKGLSRLDEAPVTVNLASESRKDALSVPVTALLAQPGGGYAVEALNPTTGETTLKPVEPGLFAGGYVEIEDGTLKEGERVTVPDA